MSQFVKWVNGILQLYQIFKADIVDFAHEHNSRIEVEANYNEFPLIIGTIPATMRVDKIVVDVLEVFDAGTITIGDDDAQGRLTVATDSDLTTLNLFVIENFVKYENDTQIKAYLTGSPTQGKLRIIVFYQ